MATTNDPRPGAKPVETPVTDGATAKVTSTTTTTKVPSAAHEARVAEVEEHHAAPGWRASYVGADDRGAAGRNVSWGAILAGTVTMLGTLALLSLLGAAIGLGGTTITSNDPFDGVGTGLAIWGVISLILAFAAGGFVTGVLSGRAGFIHGIVTWATSILGAMILASMALTSALGLVGNVLGGVARTATDAAGGVAQVTADAVKGISDTVAENIGEVNTDELQKTVNQTLRDTDIPELQPEYLQNQLNDAGQEVAEAGKQLLVNPGDYENILNNLKNQLQGRAETIGKGLDRQAISNALAANTELTQAEAEQATDNIIKGYQQAQDEAVKQLNNAEKAIDDAVASVKQGVQDGRQVAEDVTNATSSGLIWTFVGLLLGGVITAFMALWGSRLVVGREVSGELRREADANRTRA